MTTITRRPGQMWISEMVHPALTVLAWDDERTDVHGIAVDTIVGGTSTEFTCYCGFRTGEIPTDREAFDALVGHALTTCADCGGPKPSVVAVGPNAGQPDVFPRCSACAF